MSEKTKQYEENRKHFCNKVIHNNRGLLFKWSMSLYKNNPTLSLEREDYYQQGCIGIMAAYNNYQKEKGKFNSYALSYAKYFMLRLKVTGTMVLVPVYTHDELRGISKLFKTRNPKEIAIGKAMYAKKSERLSAAQKAISGHVYISEVYRDGGIKSEKFMESFPDPREKELQFSTLNWDDIYKSSHLSSNEIGVCELRSEGYSLQEIASILGVTREYIRLIENKGIAGLRERILSDKNLSSGLREYIKESPSKEHYKHSLLG